MHPLEKQQLFDAFLAEWGVQFRQVPAILRYLESYPEVAKLTGKLITEGLEESQREWVSLVERFDHPVERTFFPKHWVPIQQGDYDYFIDLSAEPFVLLEADFIMFYPGRWFYLTSGLNLQHFMSMISSPGFDQRVFWKWRCSRRADLLDLHIAQRTIIKSIEEVHLDPFTPEELFPDPGSPQPTCHLQGDRLVIRGVTVLAIGLLPHHLEMYPLMLRTPEYRHEYRRKDGITLKIVIYRLRNKGHKNILAWKALFLDILPKTSSKDPTHPYRIMGHVGFRNNTLYLKHKNPLILQEMIRAVGEQVEGQDTR